MEICQLDGYYGVFDLVFDVVVDVVGELGGCHPGYVDLAENGEVDVARLADQIVDIVTGGGLDHSAGVGIHYGAVARRDVEDLRGVGIGRGHADVELVVGGDLQFVVDVAELAAVGCGDILEIGHRGLRRAARAESQHNSGGAEGQGY